MKTVKSIWIFDVDGVITDPEKKRNTEPRILEYLAQKLKSDEPVALNTGRSLVWLVDRVINSLVKKIKNKKMLQNFFSSGEKGGMWLTFDGEKINFQKDKTAEVSAPASLKEKVKNIVNLEFSNSMFYDDTKETMITVEMKDGYPLEKYTKQQKILNNILHKLIQQENLSGNLKIDPTTIAIDIQNQHIGKGFAIEKILEWLNKIGVNPKEFIVFGDSLSSDIAMAEKLFSKNKKLQFVFVGKNKIDQSYPFPIIKPKELFEKGTLEVLRNL